MVVENRLGAAGRLGLNAVMAAPNDGYLLTFATNGALVIQPLASSALKIEPGKDYAPVFTTFQGPNALYANASVPFRDLAGLIAYAKANPGRLNCGSGGVLGTGHLSLELLNVLAGINITHVPYKGEPLGIAAILGGEIQLYSTTGGPKPHVDSGKLVVIAVTSDQRWDMFPDRPTMRESGLPGATFVTWNGIVAPPATPPDIVSRLYAAFNSAAGTPELNKRLVPLGATRLIATPDQFAAMVTSELRRMEPIIQRIGGKVD